LALSRDKILKHAGMLGKAQVHVPKWADETGDDVVVVRGVTIREWEIHQSMQVRASEDESKMGFANARLVARCVVDDTGRRVFSDDDVKQIAELGVGEVDKITDEILRVSGLAGEAAESEALGESETTPPDKSSSE